MLVMIAFMATKPRGLFASLFRTSSIVMDNWQTHRLDFKEFGAIVADFLQVFSIQTLMNEWRWYIHLGSTGAGYNTLLQTFMNVDDVRCCWMSSCLVYISAGQKAMDAPLSNAYIV